MRCRVCGLGQHEAPWGADGVTPTFDSCPCCGTQFGCQDGTVRAARSARRWWLQTGGHWDEPGDRPPVWRLERQLTRIPAGWRDDD